MAFFKAAGLDELWNGEMMACTAQGAKVLLIKLGDEIFAYEDRCAHLGVPLSQGSLEGHVLTCSAHLWQYDVESGFGVNPSAARLRPFPVKVVGGDILVDVSAAAPHAGGTAGCASTRGMSA